MKNSKFEVNRNGRSEVCFVAVNRNGRSEDCWFKKPLEFSGVNRNSRSEDCWYLSNKKPVGILRNPEWSVGIFRKPELIISVCCFSFVAEFDLWNAIPENWVNWDCWFLSSRKPVGIIRNGALEFSRIRN